MIKGSRLQIIFYIVLFSILSWMLIHVLSILGVFLAIAYPIWWFFAPRQTVCFFCRARLEGDICPLCHRTIKKSEGISPKTFTSALSNGAVILSFSLLSIGVVFGESRLLHALGFPPTAATVSFVIPSSNTYRLGEIFPLKLEVSGVVTPINAIQSDISYDPQKLEIVNISTQNSFASIFIQKEINNTVGYARLTGGLPNPGFSGSMGTFGTVYFRGKAPGVTSVKFLPTTMVLANDGKGSNVLKNFGAISYLILSDKISDAQATKEMDSTTVLGASTKGTQMLFYDDKKVLGASSSSGLDQSIPTKPAQPSIILTTLGNLDNFILSFWQKVFGK